MEHIASFAVSPYEKIERCSMKKQSILKVFELFNNVYRITCDKDRVIKLWYTTKEPDIIDGRYRGSKHCLIPKQALKIHWCKLYNWDVRNVTRGDIRDTRCSEALCKDCEHYKGHIRNHFFICKKDVE